MASGHSTRSQTGPQAAKKKRGRPIANDAALQNPLNAAMREHQRKKKREYRARKSERIRLESAEQAIRAQQATSVPTEAADQAMVAKQAAYVPTKAAVEALIAKYTTIISVEATEQAILAEQATSAPNEASEQAVLAEQPPSVPDEAVEQAVLAEQPTSVPHKLQQVQRYPIYTIVSIPPQPILAKQAIRIFTKVPQEQRYPISTVISASPQSSNKSAPLSAVPKDGPAPVIFERSRIQGSDLLPQTGCPQTEAATAQLSLGIGNRQSSYSMRRNCSAPATGKGRLRGPKQGDIIAAHTLALILQPYFQPRNITRTGTYSL